jgi:3-oxoacyl-[acyl-carrier-protein] synthase II
MRRVVVTGMGLVTPLACGTEASWRRLINGESGAGRISRFDPTDLPVQIAA